MFSKLVHLFLVEHNCAMAARRPVVVVAVAFGSTAVAMVVAVVIIIASPRTKSNIVSSMSSADSENAGQTARPLPESPSHSPYHQWYKSTRRTYNRDAFVAAVGPVALAATIS